MADRCYQLPDGSRVQASRPPSPELVRALGVLADAVREQFGEPTPEQVAKYEAGQQRIRERNARILGR